MAHSVDDQYDVIVIGAGIMGSATAYQTSKRGQKTLLLEQFDFLHHLGSSHGESRTLRATYSKDYYSEMVIQSAKLYEEAEAEIGYQVYFKAPQLDMGPNDNKSLLAVVESCKKNGILHRVLDSDQVREEFAGTIELPEKWIGLVTEIGGVIKPTKAVAMFQALAHKHGACLKDNCRVVDLKKDEARGGVVVWSSKGERFSGKKCVVTVGPWMKKLVGEVTGCEIPIQPLEIGVCYWKIKEGYESKFAIESNFPSFSSYSEPHIFGTPLLEYPGLIKILVDGGCQCDPHKRTWSVAPTVLNSLREWIEGRFGDLVESKCPVITQSCLYSMTPDKDYVIDFLGGGFGKDVVIGGGFSGHGFKMGPVVGQILADLVIDGESKKVELKHFSLKRFK